MQWCREAHLAHQQNLLVGELSIVGVALVSLLAHHIVYNYSDWIQRETDLTKGQLEGIFIATSYFAFILLAVFLVYMTVFK